MMFLLTGAASMLMGMSWGISRLPNPLGIAAAIYDRNSPVDIFCRVGDHWEGDVVHADGRSHPIGGI